MLEESGADFAFWENVGALLKKDEAHDGGRLKPSERPRLRHQVATFELQGSSDDARVRFEQVVWSFLNVCVSRCLHYVLRALGLKSTHDFRLWCRKWAARRIVNESSSWQKDVGSSGTMRDVSTTTRYRRTVCGPKRVRPNF